MDLKSMMEELESGEQERALAALNSYNQEVKLL